MTIPTTMDEEKLAYLGHTLKLGTWTWTAAVGNFTSTKLIARFGKSATPVDPSITSVELESDGSGDEGLDWSGSNPGILADLTLTVAQLAQVHDDIGGNAEFWITLEEVSPSTEVELLGIGSFKILPIGTDIP